MEDYEIVADFSVPGGFQSATDVHKLHMDTIFTQTLQANDHFKLQELEWKPCDRRVSAFLVG